jgi:hypothetical protein
LGIIHRVPFYFYPYPPFLPQPYEDCCALLCQTSRTKSAPHRVEKLEQELMPDYRGLIDATLAEMVCLEYEYGVKV